VFTEVVIAPDADEDAVALFAAKKNLRLLTAGGLPDPLATARCSARSRAASWSRSRDNARMTPADLKIVTKRQPTDAGNRDMLFAFTIAKHVKSNAIVYAKDGQTAGIGAGQMNRKDSARIAAIRAADFGLDLTG
jgi:phosphoribosylaminoimidazolecarboxamide formyltransferase/IMP cyclohydrolase